MVTNKQQIDKIKLNAQKILEIPWLTQRIAAIILVPLSFWFATLLLKLPDNSYQQMIDWLSSPLNLLCSLLWLVVGIYHAVLGMHEVLEDYIPTEWIKKWSIWVVNGIGIVLVLLGFVAIIRIVLTG
ncbi:MAG: succinate dehydrogenase, hydrophobic membrane anchor protein [Methylococcaceae bacterium]